MGFGLSFRVVSAHVFFKLSLRSMSESCANLIVLIADSVRACGRAFAEIKRMRAAGMNGAAKKSSRRS